MNLHKSVYWTKRIIVSFGLILFVCSGVRIFQFVTKKFTETRLVGNTELKAELGFDKIDRLTLTPITVEGFNPSTFRNLTLAGDLNVDNGYPKETTKTPIANVYRIIERQLSLQTSEAPRNIAKSLGFVGDPTSGLAVPQVWDDKDRKFIINGQYLWMTYENNLLRQSPPKEGSQLVDLEDGENLKKFFEKTLSDLQIQSDFSSYRYEAEYVSYDSVNRKYVSLEKEKVGDFIRINAIRVYPNLSKTATDKQTNAAYPNYIYSNNHLIIRTRAATAKPADYLVGLSIYNWLINNEISKTNTLVQTYDIKTPKAAYAELTSNKGYLISVTEWENNKREVDPEILKDVDRVNLRRIRIEMYEDTVNTGVIQPVYVFITQVVRNGKEYQLTYYVPAVAEKNLIQ